MDVVVTNVVISWKMQQILESEDWTVFVNAYYRKSRWLHCSVVFTVVTKLKHCSRSQTVAYIILVI